MSDPHSRTHLHFDDLQNFGDRIVQALRIPGKHITRMELIVGAENNFMPVLNVHRALLDDQDLGALRSVCEQYQLVRVSGAAASAEEAGNPTSPTGGL